MITRRTLIRTSGQWLAASMMTRPAVARESDALADKPSLIRRTFRAPNYETPLPWLQDSITPNGRFFVRWHLANIPRISESDWRLNLAGDALSAPRAFTLAELRRDFRPVELVAVCQCAGEQRVGVQPRVPGVQWGSGAVGNARWRGVRLRDLLERSGCRNPVVKEVAFHGGDGPLLDATPHFVKSLPGPKALDENTLVAYEMNGAPLPHWNGFPARLIVPGWAGTYWMKQLVSIEARTEPYTGFWMKTAYRVPLAAFPGTERFESQESDGSTPVTNIDLNALLANVRDGQRVRRGVALELRGVAWDAGQGIQSVRVCWDADARSWQDAQLGPDLGRFAFRSWRLRFVPRTRGGMTIRVRALNRAGLAQPDSWTANAGGYHNNVPQRTQVEVV